MTKTYDIYINLDGEQPLLQKFHTYNANYVKEGKAVGEIGDDTKYVSLIHGSHIIREIKFFRQPGNTRVELTIEVLNTMSGDMLKPIFDFVDFVPIYDLLGNIRSIDAKLKEFDGVFFPYQWNKFPIDKKFNWSIHRMSEHHNEPSWMAAFDKKRFIIHGVFGLDEVIFVVPDAIQTIFEFLLERGRLEYAKYVGLIFNQIIDFKNADIITVNPTTGIKNEV